MKMVSVAETLSTKKINILLYGEPGVGKTELIKTLPFEPSEILYIAAEPRMLSLAPTKHNRKDMRSMLTLSPKTAEEFDYVRKFVVNEAAKKFKMVWVDGLDQCGEDVLRIMKTRERAKGSKANMQSAYGDMAEVMIAWIIDIQRCPLPTVFTSHISEDKTGDIRYTFSFPGQKAYEPICNMFDEIWCMKIARLNPLDASCKPERWIQTTRNRDVQYQAKEGSGLLDDFEKPDLGNIFDKVFGKKEQ